MSLAAGEQLQSAALGLPDARLLQPEATIEVFADCFPRRINFGDVDGIVEINRNALLLEWKSEVHELPTGQLILYERLTHNGLCSAMIVVGDAETMIAVATSIFDRGISGIRRTATNPRTCSSSNIGWPPGAGGRHSTR